MMPGKGNAKSCRALPPTSSAKHSFHLRERRNRRAAPGQTPDGSHRGPQRARMQRIRALGGEDELFEARASAVRKMLPTLKGERISSR